MKDVFFYVFLILLYGILGVGFLEDKKQPDLTWKYLGQVFLLFAITATLARWSVMAFKKRPDRLMAGQKIVGIEEGEAAHVVDVVRPQPLKKEGKKPKLRRRRF